MTDAEKMRDAAVWLPCPLCGAELIQEGDGVEHQASDDCPLDSAFFTEEHRDGWNRRALTVDASIPAAGCQQAGLVTVDGRLGAVEVCGICDIAGCYHIRERQAPVRQCTDQNPIKNFPPGLLMVEVMAALEACVASLERADTQEGVCCCGDSMDRHSDPMSCGHSPVDMGDYYAGKAMDAASAALAKIRDVKC